MLLCLDWLQKTRRRSGQVFSLSTVNLGTSGFSAFSTLEPTSRATIGERSFFSGERSIGDRSLLLTRSGDLSFLGGERFSFRGDLSLDRSLLFIGDRSLLFIGDLSLFGGDLSRFPTGDLSRLVTGDLSLDRSRLSAIII